MKKALVEKEKDNHDPRKEKKNKEDKLEDLKATLAAMKKTNKDQERKLKNKEKKDFLNNLSSDNSGGHYKCGICDEIFALQSVLRFHTHKVHTASILTIPEPCKIQDHSSQTDLLVKILHADDNKGSTKSARKALLRRKH